MSTNDEQNPSISNENVASSNAEPKQDPPPQDDKEEDTVKDEIDEKGPIEGSKKAPDEAKTGEVLELTRPLITLPDPLVIDCDTFLMEHLEPIDLECLERDSRQRLMDVLRDHRMKDEECCFI